MTRQNNKDRFVLLHADSQVRLKKPIRRSVTGDVSRCLDDVRQVPVHDIVIRITIGPNDIVKRGVVCHRKHTHTHTHTRAHARTHARTHTHTHTHALSDKTTNQQASVKTESSQSYLCPSMETTQPAEPLPTTIIIMDCLWLPIS